MNHIVNKFPNGKRKLKIKNIGDLKQVIEHLDNDLELYMPFCDEEEGIVIEVFSYENGKEAVTFLDK